MHETRRRIVKLLRKRGGQTVAQLTKAMGLTRAAVMSHLAALQAEGFVKRGELRPGIRRPSTVYVLTPAADDLFPKGYSDFAALMLDEVAHEGTDILNRMLRGVGDRWIARDRPRVEGFRGHERIARAKEILAERGFMPELERADTGFTLREHNCPVMRLAVIHPQVCVMVHRWLEALFGTSLKRVQCMRDGYPFSAYVFEETEKRPGLA